VKAPHLISVLALAFIAAMISCVIAGYIYST